MRATLSVRVGAFCVVGLAITVGTGCHRAKFTVQNAPAAPEFLGSYKVPNPEMPVVIQLANFNIRTVDTQYNASGKEAFRNYFSSAIPTMLQEVLGKRQVFAEVKRTAAPNPQGSDYLILADYDFFERLGTQGREWIPLAGTFGAPINEAWVKGRLTVQVVRSDGGAKVFQREYVEEHRDRTSVYSAPRVGYLQADHLAQIAQDVIEAIRSSSVGTPHGSAASETAVQASGATDLRAGSVEERLRTLERLRRDGLISNQEYRQKRQAVLDAAF